MKVIFKVCGKPQGKARPRMTKAGSIYTPHDTVKYEHQVVAAYNAAAGNHCGWFGGEPVTVTIDARYAIPKSTTKKDRAQIESGELQPTKKPDGDNIAKIICDGLNGVAYKDDAQVTALHVFKRYTDGDPYVAVCIEAGD